MRCRSILPQLAAAAFLALCLSNGRSAAEVRLSGTQDRIVMQTNGATIPEILAALRSAFDLEVKLKGATARTFTGEYSGPVHQVLSRLLAGEDYILRSDSEGMSIVLIGKSAADNAARWSGLPPAAPGSRLDATRQPPGGAIVRKP
jgi:hypothetical protein